MPLTGTWRKQLIQLMLCFAHVRPLGKQLIKLLGFALPLIAQGVGCGDRGGSSWCNCYALHCPHWRMEEAVDWILRLCITRPWPAQGESNWLNVRLCITRPWPVQGESNWLNVRLCITRPWPAQGESNWLNVRLCITRPWPAQGESNWLNVRLCITRPWPAQGEKQLIELSGFALHWPWLAHVWSSWLNCCVLHCPSLAQWGSLWFSWYALHCSWLAQGGSCWLNCQALPSLPLTSPCGKQLI